MTLRTTRLLDPPRAVDGELQKYLRPLIHIIEQNFYQLVAAIKELQETIDNLPSGGVASGSSTIDFGASPTDEAAIAVTGQTTIASGSEVNAFFMRDTTSDNGVEEHEGMSIYCALIVGDIVAGTGFTIYANMLAGYATGQFTVRWMWS